MIVKIEYTVKNDQIKKPVCGGRYSNSGQSLCLWLKYVVRWRANSLEKKDGMFFYLEYEKMSLLTGEYYFDIAFFEEHATVPLVYKTKIRDDVYYRSLCWRRNCHLRS